MRKKILALVIFAMILVSMHALTYQVELMFPPVVSASPSVFREVWMNVSVTNTHANMNTSGDIEVALNSNEGVNIAWSTNVTEYFGNIAYWEGLGYDTYMEWLNGTSTLPYHWEEMDWYVSAGSLTSITWDDIKYWWDMYSDTGGGASYVTFMDNTYMADCNLTDPVNDPDIIGVVPWSGNNLTIEDLVVPANTAVYLVLKIVMTEPGAYTFDLTSSNPLLEISPSSWSRGGVGTILVPDDYSTIQAAIDTAISGDTIIVCDGTYIEDLGIPAAKTDLEIRPDLDASVTIKGIQNVPAASFPLAMPNIEINASGVKIHGFTIEGPDYTSGRYSSGIVIGASDVEIYDNTFKVTPAETLDEISQAMQTYHRNAIPGVDISRLNINHNVFTNLSDGAAGYEGIYINLDEGTGTVIVEHNQFAGGIVRAITTERSNTVLRDNLITTDLVPNLPGGYQGINIGGANDGDVTDVLVTGNTINGSTSGNGFMYGIKLGYSSTSTFYNVNITNNTVQMNDIGVLVKFSAAGVNVDRNNIVENTNYGIENMDASESLNASYNWWGNETGPYHPILNPTGLGDTVSDDVYFTPWLLQPYPPLVPVTELYVNPQSVHCWTGLNETFEVTVRLDNVELLYGFDFKLTWNTTLLDLTATNYNELWGAYPDTYPWQNTVNNTIGEYHLALTGTGDVLPFNGAATLATLTFTITYEPLYPNSVTSNLALIDTLLTRTKNLTEPESILHVVYNGTYTCNYTLPQISLGQSVYAIERSPYDPSSGQTKKFNVDVNVISIVRLEAFDFNLTYDPELLKFGSEWQIHVSHTNGWVVWNDTKGIVCGHADGISPLVNGTVTLATIKFQVRRGFVWNTVNHSRSCNLAFNYTDLTSPGSVVIEHEVINATYIYKPVPGDLNMDGEVDILDLAAAAHAFGLSIGDPGWDEYKFANVLVDDTINILDIVIIARNFGRTEP